MRPEGMLDRKELAAQVGMNPGTFYRKLMEFNAEQRGKGEPELKPDKIEKSAKNRPVHWFRSENVDKFKQAIKEVGTAQRERPKT